jgi:hypothetical protein
MTNVYDRISFFYSCNFRYGFDDEFGVYVCGIDENHSTQKLEFNSVADYFTSLYAGRLS